VPWHRVARIWRNSAGQFMVAFRRSRKMRALGLPVYQKVAWSQLASFGVGVKDGGSDAAA